MKYNSKYGRYFTKGGLVYRYDSKQDKLVLCKQSNSNGYCMCGDSNGKLFRVHRAIYESFVGEIPEGYVIDHINTIKDDNRLENLRCVTPKENANNILTKKHYSEAKKGKQYRKGRTWSEFGEKFKEHFGINWCENPKLYIIEYGWYARHNKTCRWEVKDANK